MSAVKERTEESGMVIFSLTIQSSGMLLKVLSSSMLTSPGLGPRAQSILLLLSCIFLVRNRSPEDLGTARAASCHPCVSSNYLM